MGPFPGVEVPMRRMITAMMAAGLLAVPTMALAGASSGRGTLELRRTAVGTILVNSRGFTIYAFTRDGRNRDNCAASRPCIVTWPAVTTVGAPITGPGVRTSLLGTIPLKGGGRQVTYAGHPLYTYVADTRPGQTTYVNILQFGGRWPAVNAAGQEIK
jgi:predicted lipoprotein with Yx(FWY)xxD motif